MAVTREVIMELGAKQAGSLRVAWRAMGTGLRKIETGAKGLVNSFLSLKGIILSGIVYGAFTKLKAAITDLTAASGRATEIQSKFRVVFKHLAADTEKWAGSFAKSVGRSETEIKSFLSTFQDMFVPMGFAREAAAGYSKEMVKLAIDVASFNDVQDPDMIRNFQSALVGQARSLLTYGINVMEAGVQQTALTEGIIDTAREMTNQEKMLARMARMYQQSEDAQGDAARTSGEWVNALKALDGAWFELRKSIGTFITESPTVQQMITDTKDLLQEWTEWIERNADTIETSLIPILEGLRERFDILAGSIKTVVGWVAQLGGVGGGELGQLADINRRMLDLARKAREEESKGSNVAKERLNTAKEISAQQRKQLQNMAAQFGLMSGLEKAQVKMMAARLGEAGGIRAPGYEYYKRMTKEQRELIGRSRILQEIVKKRGYGERAMREYGLGPQEGAVQKMLGVPQVIAKIESTVNAQIEVSGASIAKEFGDKIFPEIKKTMAEAVHMLRQQSQNWHTSFTAGEAAAFGVSVP